MRIIRIHDAEARLGSRRQVNGVGAAKKDRWRQCLINAPDSGKDLPILSEPMERSRLHMRPYLVHQGRIGHRPDRPLTQLAMEGRHHFDLPMCRTCNVVCSRQGANLIRAGFLIIEADQIAGIEIDHGVSRSRSWLMVSVESVPPRRDLRWAK